MNHSHNLCKITTVCNQSQIDKHLVATRLETTRNSDLHLRSVALANVEGALIRSGSGNLQILVVDDSRAIQIIIKRTLAKAGFTNLQLKFANTGQEALDILRTWKPDLLLTDWHMPEMTGLDLLTELNRQMLTLNIGVITTETNPSRLKQAAMGGADFIIHKPFDENDLIAKVSEFCPLPSSAQESEPPTATGEPESSANQQSGILFPSEDKLADGLAEALFSDVKVQIKSDEKYNPDLYPYVLGLLTPTNQDNVVAIGVLKQPAAKQVAKLFQKQRSASQADSDLSACCAPFFEVVAQQTGYHSESSNLTLKKSNLVNKPFERLESLFDKNKNRRRDYYVEVKGAEAFILSIICS